MSTRFVSKRQSIAPGSRLCGERQGISALESGLVKAKLELLPDSALSERELQQRAYEQSHYATERHKGQRSRFHMYIKTGLGGSFRGDNKSCLHYLATSQLLLQASARVEVFHPHVACTRLVVSLTVEFGDSILQIKLTSVVLSGSRGFGRHFVRHKPVGPCVAVTNEMPWFHARQKTKAANQMEEQVNTYLEASKLCGGSPSTCISCMATGSRYQRTT